MDVRYQSADGPSGLLTALNDTLADPKPDQYILYRHGQQNSLIKVDTSTKPVLLWYYDLDGRSAPNIVKETIQNFLQARFGSTNLSLHFKDIGLEMIHRRQQAFYAGGRVDLSGERSTLEQAFSLLRNERREQVSSHKATLFGAKSAKIMQALGLSPNLIEAAANKAASTFKGSSGKK